MSSKVKKTSQLIADLEFALGNLSDNILLNMEQEKNTQIPYHYLWYYRNSISIPFSTCRAVQPLFYPYVSSPPLRYLFSITPKMNLVRFTAFFGGVMTFTGPLDFLIFQISFNAIFGVDPPVLRITSRNRDQCVTKDTSVSICFVILFNWNMLARVYIRKKYFRIFLLHFRNSKWFIPFVEILLLLHHTTYSVV